MLNKICVYCGSGAGAHGEYAEAAAVLGRVLAENNIELIYGGAGVGLMGIIADNVLRHGGRVTGVIPGLLAEKVAHKQLSELHVVESMHERKAMMMDMADGFIAMPGGLGTFEEIFEAVTWGQLKIHSKPCALLNVCGYYDKLIEFLDFAVDEKFIRQEHRETILVSSDPDELLRQMAEFRPAVTDKLAGLKNA